MQGTQIQMNSGSYQISDGHVISQDTSDQRISLSDLIINDKKDRVFDKRYYDTEKRIKDIELCVKFDNYFANLASILSFIAEAGGVKDSNLGIVLEKIEKDLAYLQDNYTITERDFKDRYNSINIF